MKFIYTLIPLLFVSSLAYAQTSKCDALTGDAAQVAKSVMDSSYLYDCCDETISKCLNKKNVCSLAKRLADETCRLAGNGKSAAEIKHLLDQRSMVMGDVTPAVKIDKPAEFVWGNPNAKVVLSIYLCGRCPYCSRYVPELIHTLENSPIKDSVAINMRLFPIKSHENSTPVALAVAAAAKMGKAWPYLLKVYENFDKFSPELMPEMATEMGLDAAQFNALMQDAKTRDTVVAVKKEGFTNGVESTPTFFLNGRKIQSAFETDLIIGMLEEAVENSK